MSRLNRGTDSSSGASQNAALATMAYSLAAPANTRRPNHNHALSINVTPIHSRIEDSTKPWP